MNEDKKTQGNMNRKCFKKNEKGIHIGPSQKKIYNGQ